MRLRSATGSSIPSSLRPSMASRTPRTCPAHRCPCASAASSRYSARVFMAALGIQSTQSSRGKRVPSLFGSRPRMRLARFHKREDGHDHGKSRERRVFQYLPETDRFGSRKAAAIDVHVQEIGAQDNNEEPDHDEGKQRSPDAQAPANQNQESQNDFRERQCVGDELDSPGRQHLEGFHLVPEVPEVQGYGKLQYEKGPEILVGQKNLRIARVNEDAAEKEAANPQDHAAKIPGARFDHALISLEFRGPESCYFWLSN